MFILFFMIFRIMVIWGGFIQCVLDEEGDEDGYFLEGIVRIDEEEEEEQDVSFNDNFFIYFFSMN